MRRLAVVTLVVLAANALPRAAQAQTPVPRALEDWQAWVLKGREFHRCPFLAGSNPAVAESYRCAWPERLLLNVDAHGGRFSQRWQVYTESWVALPGDLVRWPGEVLVDGHSAALVGREGVPQVRLTAGAHQLSCACEWPETRARSCSSRRCRRASSRFRSRASCRPGSSRTGVCEFRCGPAVSSWCSTLARRSRPRRSPHRLDRGRLRTRCGASQPMIACASPRWKAWPASIRCRPTCPGSGAAIRHSGCSRGRSCGSSSAAVGSPTWTRTVCAC